MVAFRPSVSLGVIVVGVCAAYFLYRRRRKTTFLSSDEKQTVRLIGKQSLSHDVRKFRFALPAGTVLGLAAGRHIVVSSTTTPGLSRKYSPVSAEEAEGYFELNVKIYPKTDKFPNGGVMSLYLDSLSVGDGVNVEGPVGKCYYSAPSELTILGKEIKTRKCPSIAMMAGGVGITPFLAMIRKIFSNPADTTKVFFLFANQTEEDIFLRQELEAYAEKYSNFKLWYTLDRPPANWTYSTGFIDAPMIRDHLWDGDVPPSVFLLCGPPPMIKFACLPNLAKLGVKDSDILAW